MITCLFYIAIKAPATGHTQSWQYTSIKPLYLECNELDNTMNMWHIVYCIRVVASVYALKYSLRLTTKTSQQTNQVLGFAKSDHMKNEKKNNQQLKYEKQRNTLLQPTAFT